VCGYTVAGRITFLAVIQLRMSDKCGAPTNDGGTCSFGAKFPDGKCGHHTQHDTATTPKGKQSLLEKDESIIDLIAGEVQNEATIGEAIAEASIPRGTHDRWMAKGKDESSKDVYQKYRSEITQARKIAKKNDRKRIEKDAIDQGDLRLRWKIHMQQYGDAYEGDITATDEGSVPFAIPEELIDEWQQQITQ